jgi:hypothetical protein
MRKRLVSIVTTPVKDNISIGMTVTGGGLPKGTKIIGCERSIYCRRGHHMKTGKDGRQRCLVCQSRYTRDWRKRQKGTK